MWDLTVWFSENSKKYYVAWLFKGDWVDVFYYYFHHIHLNPEAATRGFFIKKEILAEVFSCEFCEISKKPILQSTISGRLLLQI